MHEGHLLPLTTGCAGEKFVFNSAKLFTVGVSIYRDVKPSTIRNEVEKRTPRALMIIDKVPFVLPHRDRVLLFRALVNVEKEKYSDHDSEHITVHRSRIVDDGFQQLSRFPAESLKGKLYILNVIWCCCILFNNLILMSCIL